VLCLVVAPRAKADDLNQKSNVTFTEPVEVPGVGQHLLPAGTYVFKLKDSSTDRHTTEIFSQDGAQLLTTLLSIPNHRLKASDKSVLAFSERPAGAPEVLKAWFPSGEHSGEQFVYERSGAIELAKQTNEAVLSTPTVMVSASVDALKTAPLEAVNPNGDMIETAQVVEAPLVEMAAVASAPAIAPAVVVPPPPVQEAAVTPAPAVSPEPVASSSLPQTASQLPLIWLVGLLCLGAGFGLLGLKKLKA